MKRHNLKPLAASILEEVGKNSPVIVQVTGLDIEKSIDKIGNEIWITLDHSLWAVVSSEEIEGKPIRHCDTLFAWINTDGFLRLSRKSPVSGKSPEDVEIDVKTLFPILEHFSYEHLPPHLKSVSKQFHDIAHEMVNGVMSPVGVPEISAGLRKLLEAKDCMVRAAVLGAKK